MNPPTMWARAFRKIAGASLASAAVVCLATLSSAEACDRFLIRAHAERQPGEQVFEHRGPGYAAAGLAGAIRFDFVSENIQRVESHAVEAEGVIPKMVRALGGPLTSRLNHGIDHVGHEFFEVSSEGERVILRLGYFEAARVDGADMVIRSSEGVTVAVDEGSWEGYLRGGELSFHLTNAAMIHAFEHVTRAAMDGALAQIQARFENNFDDFSAGGIRVPSREIELLNVEGAPHFALRGDRLVVQTPRVTMRGTVEFRFL